MRFKRWLPVFVWTGVIAAFSSATFSAHQTGGILNHLLGWIWPTITPEHKDLLHLFIRKGAHISAYGILSLCWHYALEARPWHRHKSLIALAGCLLTATLDESHQAQIPERTGAASDILYDMAGALFIPILAARFQASQRRSDGADSSR
jgi:VanZ family protein